MRQKHLSCLLYTSASKETQNIILRCLNYYVCDKPFYLLVDYLSVRFPTTDALEVIRKVLGMKADYFIHYDYGYYGYKEHYAYGEIKVMASDDEHMLSLIHILWKMEQCVQFQ